MRRSTSCHSTFTRQGHGALMNARYNADAYVVAKHAERYRRLAQGPTGRHRPGDGGGAARDPETDRSDARERQP